MRRGVSGSSRESFAKWSIQVGEWLVIAALALDAATLDEYVGTYEVHDGAELTLYRWGDTHGKVTGIVIHMDGSMLERRA